MFIRKFIFAIMTSNALFAASNAIVFDFGGVMTGKPNRDLVINFICDSFDFLPSEFEKANLEKRKAIKEEGISDLQFWIRYAEKKNVSLTKNWETEFRNILLDAIGVNEEMYLLVDELKSKEVPVALLSNIDVRLSRILRELNLYHPFDPCLLSCEIDAEKPNPKAYQVALDALKTPAHEVVFIDDRPENIEAAKQMGLDAILFESTAQIRKELSKRNLL